MDDTLRVFKEGIFELRTRRFGSVAEIMIKKLYGLQKSSSNAYDLRDVSTGDRVEVKFSTVMKKNEAVINEDNVVDQCIKANLSVRMVKSSDVGNVEFDCNIQQVKRTEFEVLFYGVFFYDRIAIFKVRTSEIMNTLGYSDFQHRGNEGEGQFHINERTWDYHLNTNFVQWITYEELYNLLSNDD